MLDIISLCFGLKIPPAYYLQKILTSWHGIMRIELQVALQLRYPALLRGYVPRGPTSVCPHCCCLRVLSESIWPFEPGAQVFLMTWKCSASHNCRTYDIQRCFSKTILQSHCSHGKHFSKRPFEVCQGLLTEIRQIFYNEFSKYLERMLSGKRDWLLVSKIIIFQTQNA